MNFEYIYLAYNMDPLLDLYEKIKYKAPYTCLLDKDTKSIDFIDIILKNIQYIEFYTEDDSGDENEYYNYET